VTLDDFIRDASLFESVMDVGCGTGRWTSKLTAPRVIAVDGHRPTLEVAAGVCPSATLVCCDMRKLGELFLPDCVECVVAMDVIEHLELAEALEVLKQFELLARLRVMLFVPIGDHPQTGDATNLGNVHLQQHRSTWHPEHLRELGYMVIVLPNFFGGRADKGTGAVIAVKNVGGRG